MTIQLKTIGLFALMLAATVALSHFCLAQQPETSNPYAIGPRESQLTPTRAWSNYGGASAAGARGNSSTALRQAADAVRNAKGDEDTNAARRKLGELVEKCFENDMVQRQQDLAQLEKRLANLREQLDRRKTKKSEIVDLQMKVLLNEADGLGFFSSSERGGDSKVPMVNSPYGLPVIAQPGDPTPFFNVPTPTPTPPAPPAPAPIAPRAAEAR